MKKIILIASISLMIFLAGCGNWVTPDDYSEFLACIEELENPQLIGSYMVENFTYKIHDFYTLTPYELWLIQEGDCDDMSLFGVTAADYHSYETWQIKIYDNTLFKHYVAVYDEGIWYSITDCRNYYFGFDTFREIVDYVCDIRFKTWTKYIVYDYWDDIVEEIYNN